MIRPFWYLATPYSKYPGGIEPAFELACKVSADLLRLGVPVYSPIVHSHSIAKIGGIDPLDHKIWLPADAPMMDAATGLIVATAHGWQESFGIAEEIKVFEAAGKKIRFWTPTTLERLALRRSHLEINNSGA